MPDKSTLKQSETTRTRTQYDLMHPIFNAMDDSNLSASERFLLIALYRRMDGNGICHPSYNDIIKTTGLSKPTISSCIKKLTKEGWITYTKGNKAKQQANTYQLNLVKIGVERDPRQTVIPFPQV